MNRYANKMAQWTAAVFIFAACAGAPQFSTVMNRDWNLAEIRTGQQSITFQECFGDIFTLRFDTERVNGIGAPNRYFAPYTLADKQGITIKTVAQTQMLAIREPEKLKEHDYFVYLQNAAKWNLAKENLELYSTGEDGAEAVLVFVPAIFPNQPVYRPENAPTDF
jgi:heat shock protein HslJ